MQKKRSAKSKRNAESKSNSVQHKRMKFIIFHDAYCKVAIDMGTIGHLESGIKLFPAIGGGGAGRDFILAELFNRQYAILLCISSKHCLMLC